MVDLATVGAAAGAVKVTFDSIRAAIGLLKDAKSLLPPDEPKTKAITLALDEAESAAKIAEAQVAQSLGYELCRAHFPPLVMLVVGYHTANADASSRMGKPVFECPQCKADTAGPYGFQRNKTSDQQ